MSPTQAVFYRFLALVPLTLLVPAANAQRSQGSEETDDGPSLTVLQNWQFHNNTAWRYLYKQDYARAEERFRLAIETLGPYHASSQRLLARSYADLARVLYHQGRYEQAEPLAKWALAARENHPKTTPESIFQSLYTLGVIERALKHYDEARSLLKRALALQERAVSHDNPSLAMTIEELAYIDREDSKFVMSDRYYKRAIAIREKQNLPNNLDLAATYDDYADLLTRMKFVDDAEKWHDKARAIREASAQSAREEADRRAAVGYRGFK
jgi:tetratricopeptide (TPR) repeat protein